MHRCYDVNLDEYGFGEFSSIISPEILNFDLKKNIYFLVFFLEC